MEQAREGRLPMEEHLFSCGQVQTQTCHRTLSSHGNLASAVQYYHYGKFIHLKGKYATVCHMCYTGQSEYWQSYVFLLQVVFIDIYLSFLLRVYVCVLILSYPRFFIYNFLDSSRFIFDSYYRLCFSRTPCGLHFNFFFLIYDSFN